MEVKELIKDHSGKIQASFSTIVKIIVFISILHSTYFHLWHILFADILLLVLLFMPFILRKSYKIEIPREFEFILLIFVLALLFLGDKRGFVVQAFFGIAIGFIGFTIMLILFSNSKLKPNYFMIILFSFSVSLALGLCAEMLKYYLKLYLDYSIQDTEYTYLMRGLSLVALGAFISSIIGYSYMKGYRTEIMKKIVARFKKKNPDFFIERTDSPEELLKLIKKGENEKLEFKSTLRMNLHTGEKDKKVEHSILKSISAFLNSEGGTLLIGISDIGEILGIEKDEFENNDKFNRHFTNLIKEKIGNEYLPFMDFELFLVEGKNIMKVTCRKSNKPVFLKNEGNEEFYIRVGASTIQINGHQLLDYIKNKFS